MSAENPDIDIMSTTKNARNRRVLIILEGLALSRDRRAWSQATTLAKNGYHVSIITPGESDEPAYDEIGGIYVYRYPSPPERQGKVGYLMEYSYSFAQACRLAWRVHREQGFDVIQAANPPDILYLIARFYKIFFKKGFVFDHRDISPEIYRYRFGNSRQSMMVRLLLWLERCSYKAADVVMTVNESVKSLAAARNHTDASRIFVVRCGPDIEKFHAVEPDEAMRMGRKHLVCYVGIMGAHDGVEYLVRAADHVINTRGRNDVSFVIVGYGDALDGLRELSQSLGLADYIRFTGMIRDDKLLLGYMSTADVCVSPEPKNDLNDRCSFVKIAEYLAVGKPVVAFDLIEAKNSAQDAALYATPNDVSDLGDRIIELLDDPERREAMSESALRRSREFLCWAHSEKHLLAAYDALFTRLN